MASPSRPSDASQPCGRAPTWLRIVSSRWNDESTCSRASARAPSGLRAAIAAWIDAVLALVRSVELVDRLVPGRPHRRPREGPARALRDLLDVGQLRHPVDHVVEAVVRLHPLGRERRGGRRPARVPGARGRAGRSAARPARARPGRPRSSARRRSPSRAPRARREGGTSPTSPAARSVRTRKPRFGLERDEPERLEPPQRLAQRRPADAVLGRERLLPEHRARRELAEDDRLLDRERDLVGLRASRLHPCQCTAATGPAAAASRKRVKRIQFFMQRDTIRIDGLRPVAITARNRVIVPSRLDESVYITPMSASRIATMDSNEAVAELERRWREDARWDGIRRALRRRRGDPPARTLLARADPGPARSRAALAAARRPRARRRARRHDRRPGRPDGAGGPAGHLPVGLAGRSRREHRRRRLPRSEPLPGEQRPGRRPAPEQRAAPGRPDRLVGGARRHLLARADRRRRRGRLRRRAERLRADEGDDRGGRRRRPLRGPARRREEVRPPGRQGADPDEPVRAHAERGAARGRRPRRPDRPDRPHGRAQRDAAHERHRPGRRRVPDRRADLGGLLHRPRRARAGDRARARLRALRRRAVVRDLDARTSRRHASSPPRSTSSSRASSSPTTARRRSTGRAS